MAEVKITTHTTYTYETADGREFKSEYMAKAWQETLNIINDIIILDSTFEPEGVNSAYYIFIKTEEQYKALRQAFDYNGVDEYNSISGVGYWYYDEDSDTFKNLEQELGWLQEIKSKLDARSLEGGYYV